MKKYYVLLFWLLVNFLTLLTGLAQANLATWNYNTLSGLSPTSYASDLGSGTSSVVGPLTPASAATGMDPVINNGCGSQNGTNPGAWSFSANPGTSTETSGVQFNVSTVGFQNIVFTWDQRWSNTATNTVRVAYTLDGLTWTNFVMTPANSTFCNGSINANGCFETNSTGDIYRRISVNFSSIVGASDNAQFGVRLLASHYQSTTEFRQVANASNIATAGTWRFDNVSFQASSPNVSIASASNFAQVSENVGTINVPVTISNSNGQAVNLTFGLSTYSNATENSDFTWTNTLTIPALSNGIFNLPISITDDAISEKAERIIVKILSGSNALISSTNNYQIIFVKDNDLVLPVPSNELNLNLLTSLSNGAAGTNSAEIVQFDSTGNRLYIVNSIGAKLDIYNLSNPMSPVLVNSQSLTSYGNINSLAAHNGVVALAIESTPAQNNGKVVFMDTNGVFINQVTVGAMPDMITFNKDYTKLLTANEGEPSSDYSVDPEGSVSIIDLSLGYANLTNSQVNTLTFTNYNSQTASLLAQGIRIFSTSASVAQDLEPEFIAVSDDNLRAYVTLQENNAMLTIDLVADTILSLKALGLSDYGVGSGNAMDASDQSGAVLITGDLPIKGVFMPDAVEFATINGQGYLFTANEGDSREFGSVVDANRISSSTFSNLLDSTVFPDQHILKNNKFLGRLSALKYSGDTDGDGDYDQLHVMGGRSFSIWDPTTGNLVYDSKDLIEQITANHPTFGAIFNASNSTGTPALKNRSDDKGSEPEGVTVHQMNGQTYAFIGLERIGGVMIFNVSIPTSPVYVGYANNRSTTASGPDLGTEGIVIVLAEISPNGKTLLLLANEVSSTVSIYEINTCAEISGGIISAVDSAICSGQAAWLTLNETPNVTYQWILNNQPLTGANADSIFAIQGGSYAVAISNATLGCADTSEMFVLTENALPVVSAGLNQSVCAQTTIVLSASGDSASYTWDNGVINGVPFMQTVDSVVYTVTAMDSNNCSNSAQVSVYVLPLPLVDAGSDMLVCAESAIVLTATGDSAQYTWTNGVLDGVSFVPTADSAFYSVTAMDANNCSNSDSILVELQALPVVDLGSDTLVCSYNLPIDLLAVGTGTSFMWNTGASSAQISVNSAGIYWVTNTDSLGCEASDSIIVTVSPCLSLSENEIDFEIYPNPNNGKFTVNFENYVPSKLIVFTLSGEVVFEKNVENSEMVLNLEGLSKGIYLLGLQTEDKTITKKLIVQ